ncbi:hypothetical protein [Kutzneria sp. NPDC051319]|uniref:hypothetical protein n=1 Tax=Kutzneria sp. NPDC051319 TaxID=3155047 RepID=UPI003424D5A5
MLAVIMALLGEMSGSAAAAVAPPPTSAPSAMPMSVDSAADDDEDEFNRQLVEDIARLASEPEVRQAAQEALDSHDPAKIIWFLDHGEAEAKARAAERKRAEAAHNRELVQGWAQTGGPKVRAAAQAALASGDDQALADFVLYGHDIAEKQDQQDVADAKAEQERITGRVRDMVAHGGPQVKVEGTAALASGDYTRIKAFYLTGYADANQRDHDFEAAIEKALDDRNEAVEALTDLARRTAAAAQARAEILRANIEAVKALDDVTLAMKLGTTAAHRADEIVREDLPGRQHGQPGRTPEIDALRASATQEADAAGRAAQTARGTTAAVQNAAVDLLHTGMTNGLDWAKVTIAVGAAVEACAQATATAQHAAEASLADSRALDADNRAEQHAENAKKWRAEAERQAQTAADLATAAKQQQDIAIGARDRAKAQQIAAENAAAQARQHAANARAARVNAQGAAGNAVAKSNAAVAANNDAVRDGERERDAKVAAYNTGQQLKNATTMCYAKQQRADQIEAALKAARDQATAEGKDADAVTKDIAADAARARSAANESAAWEGRARAAAATAQAEAAAASAAAQRSREAAAKADQEAQTARRAADDANQLAMQAANVAANSQAAADQTRYEAEGAVTEANQAVFQADVADRSSAAASASASLVIDPARMAEVIATPFANINGDARQVLAAVADAIQLSQQLAKSAHDRAAEADQAADRAKKAADAAVADVKPAYDAAVRAAQSAQQAASYAVGAVDAANAAAGFAQNAHNAATNATRAASAAQVDAVVAGRAADMASNAAYIAGQAADAASKIETWADAVTAAIHDFGDNISHALDQFEDLKAKATEAERLAREEAEHKRDALNHQFIELAFQGQMCAIAPVSLPCAQLAAKAGGALVDGIGATADYVKDGINCLAGDENACNRFNTATVKVYNFIDKAVYGFLEGAKSFWDGLVTLGGCFIETASLNPGSDCGAIKAGIQNLIDNPYQIIHLDVWHDDPGRAFGLTAFDVLSTVATTPIGGAGGAVSKVLDTVSELIAKATTRLVDGVGHITEFTVRVLDVATGKLADWVPVIGTTVRIEGGLAKLDTAVVLFGDRQFPLRSLPLKVEGDISKIDSAVASVEGGFVRVENGVATLEDAKIEFKPAPKGTLPPEFPKSGADVPGGGWEGEEFGTKLSLTAEQNTVAKQLLAQAKESAKTVTPKIENLEKEMPGTRLDGLKDQLKGDNSLKRKLATEFMDGATTETAVAKVNDALRYTLVLPDKDYAVLAEQTIEKLKAADFKLEVLKNKWRQNKDNFEYRGINLTLFDPATNQVFELQLHTEASLAAKTIEHGWYDLTRLPGVSEMTILYAQAQSKLIFGDVPFPDGAIKVGSVVA